MLISSARPLVYTTPSRGRVIRILPKPPTHIFNQEAETGQGHGYEKGVAEIVPCLSAAAPLWSSDGPLVTEATQRLPTDSKANPDRGFEARQAQCHAHGHSTKSGGGFDERFLQYCV